MSRIFSLRLFFAALALIFVLPLHAAQAQTSRLYFASYLGMSDFSSVDFTESSSATGGGFELDDAYSFAGALGIRLSSALRAEAELSYRNADISRITFSNGAGSFDNSGEIESYIGMLNVYYDFDMKGSKIQPFVSAGFGFGWHDAEVRNDSGLAAVAVDSAYNVMWQLGGGAKYRIDPKLAVTGGYRYMGGTDLEIGSYDLEYSGHEFRLGLEHDLGGGP